MLDIADWKTGNGNGNHESNKDACGSFYLYCGIIFSCGDNWVKLGLGYFCCYLTLFFTLLDRLMTPL